MVESGTCSLIRSKRAKYCMALEIQWVYQTDKNYWAKVVEPTVRCGCGTGRECDPMLWAVRQVPA